MNIASESGATPPRVNPFLEADLAARYERWYSGPGCQADLLEKRLLQRMLIVVRLKPHWPMVRSSYRFLRYASAICSPSRSVPLVPKCSLA